MQDGRVQLALTNKMFQFINCTVPEVVANQNISLTNLWFNMEVISQINVHMNRKEANYRCGTPGNLMAWSGYSWEKNPVIWQQYIKEKEITMDSLCNQQDPYTVMIPIKMKLRMATSVCSRLGKIFRSIMHVLDCYGCNP